MALERSRKRYIVTVISAASLAFVFLLGAALIAAGQGHKAAKPVKPAKPAPAKRPPPDAVVPFKQGEQLSFRVLWSKYGVNAGAIQFFVAERRDFFGHSAWHFRVNAQSVQTIRIAYPLDDQFDSYTDTVQLASLQYEMYVHEQGKQETAIWRLFSDTLGAPAAPGGEITSLRVPSGTRDPIAMLYALRAADWKKAPEFRSPVFDGRQLYDVVARVDQPAGQVTVPAGQFNAFGIDVRATPHGQDASTTHFSLWLASDEARTPVLIEADLPIGSARVELTGRP